jgi:hypothetical protein
VDFFHNRCARVSERGSGDSEKGQAFRAGVVTHRVWIESFDRFVHFVISSARLCLLMLLLFWRFPNSLSLDGASIIKGPYGRGWGANILTLKDGIQRLSLPG